MNDGGLRPQPYDKLLHKALECLGVAAGGGGALRDGNTNLVATKQNEATSLMTSYDIMYGHNPKENSGGEEAV